MIDDKDDVKPGDWVDAKEIDDPEDVKPDGYDDVEKQIRDPEASKPEDWDDEGKSYLWLYFSIHCATNSVWCARLKYIDFCLFSLFVFFSFEDDGEWEAPLIENPEYKGKFIPFLTWMCTHDN